MIASLTLRDQLRSLPTRIFLDLARDAGGAADLVRIQVARQLLRDRRAALQIPLQGIEQCADGAAKVDAVVLEEAVVLDGYQCIDRVRRDLVQRHPLPVQLLVLRQFAAVTGQQQRRLTNLGLAQIADARCERDQHQHVQQHNCRRHQRGQAQPLRGGSLDRLQRGKHARSVRRSPLLEGEKAATTVCGVMLGAVVA